MKTVRRLAPLLLLLLAGFADPPVVPDASLDGLWFKLQLKAKGRGIDHDGSGISKASASLTSYLHLSVAEMLGPGDGEVVSTLYSMTLVNETTPGMFESEALPDLQVAVTSVDNYVLPGLEAQFVDELVLLQVHATLLIHVKRDKQGAVQSAKLSTLGADVDFGGIPGQWFFGGAKITGKTLAPEDLPFDA